MHQETTSRLMVLYQIIGRADEACLCADCASSASAHHQGWLHVNFDTSINEAGLSWGLLQ